MKPGDKVLVFGLWPGVVKKIWRPDWIEVEWKQGTTQHRAEVPVTECTPMEKK